MTTTDTRESPPNTAEQTEKTKWTVVVRDRYRSISGMAYFAAAAVLYTLVWAFGGFRYDGNWIWAHVALAVVAAIALLAIVFTGGSARLPSVLTLLGVIALIIAVLVLPAMGDTGGGDEGSAGNGTSGDNGASAVVTTPEDSDRDYCPNGTSDNLRFELDELEHPQSLTPPWPQDYEEQTTFLFGPEGVACDNVQILTALAYWLDDEGILGESDGDVQASSAEWIALLRENGERRLDILEAVHNTWNELALVNVVDNERFDGDIYRFVPPNPDTLVWDQFDMAEHEGLLVADYTVHRGETDGTEHLLMSLRHGWALDEDVPLAADIEDNPELEEPTTGPPPSNTSEEEEGSAGSDEDTGGADTGDTTGPGDDNGESGEPGNNGTCDPVNPSEDCEGEDDGGGGPGGDEDDEDCPGCPGDGDGGGGGDDGCDDCPGTSSTSSSSTSSTTTSVATTTTNPPTTTSTTMATTTTVPFPDWNSDAWCDISGPIAFYRASASSSDPNVTFTFSPGKDLSTAVYGTDGITITITAHFQGKTESRTETVGDCGKGGEPPPPPAATLDGGTPSTLMQQLGLVLNLSEESASGLLLSLATATFLVALGVSSFRGRREDIDFG